MRNVSFENAQRKAKQTVPTEKRGSYIFPFPSLSSESEAQQGVGFWIQRYPLINRSIGVQALGCKKRSDKEPLREWKDVLSPVPHISEFTEENPACQNGTANFSPSGQVLRSDRNFLSF